MKICVGRPKYCLFLLTLALLMTPSLGWSQTLYGDPSLTLYGISRGKIEIGGNVIKDQKIKIEDTVIHVATSTQNLTWDIPESTEKIESEHLFLTAAWGLGKMGDIFATIGQHRIKEPFDRNYSISGGGGIRISPPQTGAVKVGLLLQAYYFSSEDNNIASYAYGQGTTANGSQEYFSADGTGKEKIAMTRYDAVLGFGIDKIPYFRPYAGLLLTMINGTVEGSFSGQDYECIYGSSCTSSQVSFSFERDISSDSSIGGIAGVVLNPAQDIGITIESQFGPHTSYGASAFVRF